VTNVEDIRQQLIDHQWMTAEEADAAIAEWKSASPGAADDGEALLAWLTERRSLTPFQAKTMHGEDAGPLMLGPYRLLEQIAVGRLGSLYRAVHEASGEAVCLKLFPAGVADDPEWLGRMQREIDTGAELDHPNVMRTLGVEECDGNWYVIMEDLEGESLQDRLVREGRLPWSTATGLMNDAAQGLAYLHDKFVVHRDVRPANLWITTDGQVKVLELGSVRNALSALEPGDDATLTTSGTIIGVYDYMSPEQAKDPHGADHRSDIYSLGCTFYHCLAGRPPFVEKNPVMLVMRHATAEATPLGEVDAEIPADVAEIVDAMLAKSPDDRIQTMRDVATALAQHLYD
jgi:eukaryotic-like serine/threonine-protein kinase